MRPILAALVLFAPLLAAAPAAAVELRNVSLSHDGIERRALLEMAPGTEDAPLLVVLHGGIAGPEWTRRRAQVGLAREGWAVLWPYAVDDWNDGRLDRRGRPYDDADDLGFLRRLVAELAAAGIVDPSKVFFAGPSLGGTMVLRVLCEAPELVAGAAVAISSLPAEADCAADGPARPVIYMHGTADRIMPPEGGPIGGGSIFVRDRGRVRPVDETLGRLAARNGCDGWTAEALPDRAAGDGSRVVLREYEGCAAPLLHYVVEGGGHAWPGAGGGRAATMLIGETNRDFSATAAVERFFKALAED